MELPVLDAPSPKRLLTGLSPWMVLPKGQRQRRAGYAAADDAVGAKESPGPSRQCASSRPPLTLAIAGGLAYQLDHHLVQIAALGDTVTMATMGAADVIIGPEGVQTPTATASSPRHRGLPLGPGLGRASGCCARSSGSPASSAAGNLGVLGKLHCSPSLHGPLVDGLDLLPGIRAGYCPKDVTWEAASAGSGAVLGSMPIPAGWWGCPHPRPKP